MYAHLVCSTGMSWDQVRHEMDIPRMEAFYKYQEHSPPTHQLVAAYFGIKKPAEPAPVEDQGAALINLINGMNG